MLGDKTVLQQVEEVVKMVAKASEKGLNADGSMVHEANLDTGHIDTERHWWVQAEAVVGFYNLYQYFGDEEALRGNPFAAGSTSKTTSTTGRAANGGGAATPTATSTGTTTRQGSGNALTTTHACAWRSWRENSALTGT